MTKRLTKKEFESSLENLSSIRPVFHSEADFQFALAQQFAMDFPYLNIRLEKRLEANDKEIYIDLYLENSKKSQIIELKYKTAELIKNINGEDFKLKQHAANDLGSYDFLKDIERIETIGCEGFACMISNDPIYWDYKRQYKSIYKQFRLTQSAIKNGKLDWIRTDYKDDIQLERSITKQRNKVIILNNEYFLNWEIYSEQYSFKYLLVEIP